MSNENEFQLLRSVCTWDLVGISQANPGEQPLTNLFANMTELTQPVEKLSVYYVMRSTKPAVDLASPITEDWLIENGFAECLGVWFHKGLDIFISDIYRDGTYIWTALPGKQMTKITHLLALMIWLESVQPPIKTTESEGAS
jgi:hypothetical protein